jgi:LuxR family transcriptional regulator, maltose regulon positive regulatory protein
MVEEHPKPRIRPRRIIERPRLLRALDESDARIKLLVAGPGWGKTVLAEQWARDGNRAVGWFRGRRSATDVAVVARGLVDAAAPIVPGAGRRMVERLAVTEDPERESGLLAEMLAEDLQNWPSDAWLALDSYEHVVASGSSDEFVRTLIQQAPVNVLLIGRARSSRTESWARAPQDTHEVTKQSLAMTTDEVSELLHGCRSAKGNSVLFDGWPALVALASMLPNASTPKVRSLGAVHDFYSAELLSSLEPGLQDCLLKIVLLPVVDRELVEGLLGAAVAHHLWTQSVELGIADERDDRLEVQPLLLEYLQRQASKTPEALLSVPSALSLYRRRRDWDSSFEIVRLHGLDDELVTLVFDSVDEILFSGRLSTLRDWVRFARTRDSRPHPVFAVLEVELDMRHGRLATALTKARSLIETDSESGDVRYRLCMVAARAAHGGGLAKESLHYYRQARECAPSAAREREARWGELMCTSTLELPDAQELLDELVDSAVTSDASDLIRVADRQLSVGFRLGFVRHLSDSRRVAELVDQVGDPFVRGSFLSVHAWALCLGAYYNDALEATRKLLTDAIELRVDPVLPYAYSMQAVAFAGLGKYAEAERSVQDAERVARRINDQNGLQNAYAIRVRNLLQNGAAAEACALEPPDLSSAIPSMRGEVLSSRALALSTIARIEDATELAEAAARATRGVETQALCLTVNAVCSLKARRDDVLERCEMLIEHVFATGSADLAVTGYRANPELLATLLASRRLGDKVVFLIRRAGDEKRAEALGLSPISAMNPVAHLSAREREVYALLCEGVSNAEIARRLFIAVGTVKSHVHHVFDKLGVRSRSALALNAARDRYATSAVVSTAESGDDATTMPKPDPRAAL